MNILGKKKKKKTAKSEELLDIEVRVGRAHSSPKTVTLNGARTPMDALNAAGLVKKDSEIVSVNGKEVDEDELDDMELEDGDRVTLVRNVEGGNN
jgi:sulfur carrier protein ThiS